MERYKKKHIVPKLELLKLISLLIFSIHSSSKYSYVCWRLGMLLLNPNPLYLNNKADISLSPEASHYKPCKIWSLKKCPPLQNMSLAVKFTQTENVDNFSLFILRSSARYLCVFYLPCSLRDWVVICLDFQWRYFRILRHRLGIHWGATSLM